MLWLWPLPWLWPWLEEELLWLELEALLELELEELLELELEELELEEGEGMDGDWLWL